MNYFAITIILILVILSLSFYFRSKITNATAQLPRVLFPVFLVVCLTSSFWDKPFEKAAVTSLEITGITIVIEETDDYLDKLNPATYTQKATEEAKSLWDKAKDFVSQEPQDQPKETPTKKSPKDEGFLKNSLYPKLITLLVFVYRALALVLSILGLITCIYLGYALESFNRVRELEKRVKELEVK